MSAIIKFDGQQNTGHSYILISVLHREKKLLWQDADRVPENRLSFGVFPHCDFTVAAPIASRTVTKARFFVSGIWHGKST